MSFKKILIDYHIIDKNLIDFLNNFIINTHTHIIVQSLLFRRTDMCINLNVAVGKKIAEGENKSLFLLRNFNNLLFVKAKTKDANEERLRKKVLSLQGIPVSYVLQGTSGLWLEKKCEILPLEVSFIEDGSIYFSSSSHLSDDLAKKITSLSLSAKKIFYKKADLKIKLGMDTFGKLLITRVNYN